MSAKYESSKGMGRTKVSLSVNCIGNDLVVFIYNENPHIGAVSIGEYDNEQQRVSVSVITRLGHKDDIIAQGAAKLISDVSQRPVCVIAGLHLDNITPEEISKIIENAGAAVNEFIKKRLAGLKSL